jgi:hypothetical protein
VAGFEPVHSQSSGRSLSVSESYTLWADSCHAALIAWHSLLRTAPSMDSLSHMHHIIMLWYLHLSGFVVCRYPFVMSVTSIYHGSCRQDPSSCRSRKVESPLAVWPQPMLCRHGWHPHRQGAAMSAVLLFGGIVFYFHIATESS